MEKEEIIKIDRKELIGDLDFEVGLVI